MKSEINRILMLVMKDGERHVYSVPNGREPTEILKDIVDSPDINKEDIKTNYYFPNTIYNVNDYLHYFDEETKRIDEVPLAINFKIREFQKERSHFFNILDLEFMKSLEESDVPYKDHIVEIKNYLRDAPRKISEHCKNLPVNEVVKFNAFNNIFKVDIIYSGSGYEAPPKVTIDPPDMSGFQAEAVALLREGKVLRIIMTKIGSGYSETPAIIISPPGEEGETALAVTSPPENDIYTLKQTLSKQQQKGI